ncbi:hypothetical protein [Rickettsia asembonensis]|uniref:hypothetical protein n=1 Tax=Rickettsia asembonensis TaxID=1068590 RepID=UPI0019D6E04F|nr:hypothetical protein [Rickettsia asembonensis]
MFLISIINVIVRKIHPITASRHCPRGSILPLSSRGLTGLVAWLLCHSRESGNPEKKV